MTGFKYSTGDTFQPNGLHCHIIISDTEANPEEFVHVNFTSLEPYKDQSCIINAGEHPYVTHPTCIMYSRARITKRAVLEKTDRDGLIRRWDPVSPDLLARIRAGAAKTDQLPQYVEEFLKHQGIINND